MTRARVQLDPAGMDHHVLVVAEDGSETELIGVQRATVTASYDSATTVRLDMVPDHNLDNLEFVAQVLDPDWPPTYHPLLMRRFTLERIQDVSGVSGVGTVAMGVDLGIPAVPGGPNICVIHWFGEYGTTVVHHRGLHSINAIHGHDGRTVVVYHD